MLAGASSAITDCDGRRRGGGDGGSTSATLTKSSAGTMKIQPILCDLFFFCNNVALHVQS